jgi:hypothetical protein
LTSLRSPGDTAVASWPSLPPAEDAPLGGPGASVAVAPQTATGYDGEGRFPRFLGGPGDGSLGSWTPVGSTRQAVTACRHGPRVCQGRGLPTRKVSRLDVQAFRLAVYASWGRSPAATQDSLPAAGQLYRVGLVTHRTPMKGFRDAVVTSLPPFPGFAWRNDTFFFFPLYFPCAGWRLKGPKKVVTQNAKPMRAGTISAMMIRSDKAMRAPAGDTKSTHSSLPGGPSKWRKPIGNGMLNTRRLGYGWYSKKKPPHTPSIIPVTQAKQ